MANRKESNKFSNIETANDLKMYLDDAKARLRNSPSLFHYTTFSNAVKILNGKLWHLGNASEMNDRLEYNNGDPRYWKNLFFGCFMCEDRESIGMWSMYAQPWESGVKITLPKDVVIKWIQDTKEIIEISLDNYSPTGRKIKLNEDKACLKLSSVAYCNADSLQKNKDEEKITWSNVTNKNITNAVRIPELTGYIKDMAWSYEKEVRIKAELKKYIGIKRVAIPITDDVFDNMIITASPLFEGDIRKKIRQHTYMDIKTDESIFTDRLNIKTICKECEYKIRKNN